MTEQKDPYQRLIDEARKVAVRLETLAIKVSVTDYSIPSATDVLRAAIANLEEHLTQVVNRGGQIEIHRFNDREPTPVEKLYRYAAVSLTKGDSDVSFDGEVIVSEGDDDGAFVSGWYWVPTSTIVYPQPFEAEVRYQQPNLPDETVLGTDQCFAFNQSEARRTILENMWNPRLDATDAVPIVDFVDLTPDMKTFNFMLPDSDPDEDKPVEITARSPSEALQILQIYYENATLEWLTPTEEA